MQNVCQYKIQQKEQQNILSLQITFFFKVQDDVKRNLDHHNPIENTCIDLNIYENDKLIYSSIATKYLYMKEHDLLQEDRKQAKLQDLQLRRQITSFPIPRLPQEQINLIKNENIKQAFQEYISQIPEQYQAIQQRDQEEQNYYSKLDNNKVPQVKNIFKDNQFFQLFQNIINNYIDKYQTLEEYSDEEHVEITMLFRFILQFPYIPPYSTLCKKLLKQVKFSQMPKIQNRINKILKVKVLQEMLQASLTRRWEISEKFDEIQQTFPTYRNQEYEQNIKQMMTQIGYDDSIKVCYSNVDYLLSNIFSLIKLLKNIESIDPQLFGTLISLFFGSHAYSFTEMRPFLVKKEGLLQWMMKKDIKDFEMIYKAGVLSKLIIALEYYKEQLQIFASDVFITQQLNQELYYLLIFTRKTLSTKNAKSSKGITINQKRRIQKIIKDLRPYIDEQNVDQIDSIEKLVFK